VPVSVSYPGLCSKKVSDGLALFMIPSEFRPFMPHRSLCCNGGIMV